tara:strand:- start:76 stop:531 length:456 start_codon:yes stop_codon:yes gene_type:complete
MKEIKKSTVTSCQANGTWEGNYGLMYKYEVAFENGDSGEYSSKSENQNKFVVGEVAYYEYTSGKYPKVKPQSKDYAESVLSNPGQSSGNSSNNAKDIIIARQSSLKCATDYCIANGGTPAEVIEIAELFTDFAINGKKVESKPMTTTDLPF